MISNFIQVYTNTKEAFSLFEKIIFALQKTAERPGNYGWFHLFSILLTITLTVLLCVFFRNTSEKKFRIIVGVCWGIMVCFEVYKQLVFSFNADLNVWDYPWYIFPYQFCSTPLYVLPFVVFLKDGKVRDGILVFVSTFAFFGGLAVYVFPGDVFSTDLLGVQIQTMVHHGLQVVLGIYIAVYNRKKLSYKTFLYALPVFVVLLLIAFGLNVIMYNAIDETFNMFFISPYFDCTLPVLGSVRGVVPYVVFLLVYVFGFALCAFIMYLLIKGGIELVKKVAEKIGNNR